MIIYNYSNDTKEYLYSETATKDIMASEREGKFIPLMPFNSTLQKPLKAKQGYAIIFEDKWKYIKDYRGQKVINLESEMTSSVDYLGDIKQGYMLYSDYIKTDEYKKRQEIEKRKTKFKEINSKIFELQQEMQIEEIKGNLLNVKVYKDVINGLIKTREAL